MDATQNAASLSNAIPGATRVAFKRFSQEAMRRAAQDWQFPVRFGESAPYAGLASEFTWTQHDHFPVARLPGTRAGWLRWWRSETRAHRAEGRGEYYRDLERWWLTSADEHLVVVVGTDDKLYLWEGSHRTAVAKIHAMATVPVFLGRRPKLKGNALVVPVARAVAVPVETRTRKRA